MISVTITTRVGVHRYSFDLDKEEAFTIFALKSHTYLTTPAYGEGVIKLTATGRSLEKIKEMFTGLPMVRTLQVITWTGDHATFILENLRTYAFELSEWKQES
jgi:hypothetical protein